MSQRPARSERGADMPGKKNDEQPTDAPAPEQQTQHEYAAQVLAFSLVKTRDELEEQFSKTHTAMLDLWGEEEHRKEAEKFAHLLLPYSILPLIYRASAHMVLAWGEHDRLFHARKMILVAQCEPALDNDADSDLLKLAHETLAKVETELSEAKGKAEGSEKDVGEGPVFNKDKDAEGSKDDGDEHQ